jgi:predicted naringenin-chalcone synthase
MAQGSVYLHGIGKAVPPFSIHQEDAVRAAIKFCVPEEPRKVEMLYELTRIQKRGSVVLENNCEGEEPVQDFFSVRRDAQDHGPDTGSRMQYYMEKAPGLALEASTLALKNSGTRPEEISQLVTVSCTGFSSPGFDIHLIKRLGLSPETGRTHIGFMGCHAMFNAFRAGAALAQATPQKKVLLCSVELCTLHFSYAARYDHVLSNALFADGASAAVLSAKPSDRSWKLLKSGSCVFPNSEELMQWHIGNHGFTMVLSDKIPAVLAKNLRPWIESWLRESGMGLKDIRSWAIHPGGPRILDEIELDLSLSSKSLDGSREVLAFHGNMSSATILFILEKLFEQEAPTPCIALAFGPGLTVECALFLS